MNIAFCNGSWIEENQAAIPLNDRGFLFGDGVFTTIRVQAGAAHCLELHLERLRMNCLGLKIIPPEINPEWINELIKKNNAHSGVWRLKIIVTGGNYQELRLPPRPHGKLILLLKPYTETAQDLRLTLYPQMIFRPVSPLKTLSYLDRLWVAEYASQQGFDDAVVLSPEGYVLETAFSNIFWKKGNEVFIPSADLPLLFGVSLGIIGKIVKKKGMKVVFTKSKPEDIGSESQLYLCNAMRGVVPVKECFGKNFARDLQADQQIQEDYLKFI